MNALQRVCLFVFASALILTSCMSLWNNQPTLLERHFDLRQPYSDVNSYLYFSENNEARLQYFIDVHTNSLIYKHSGTDSALARLQIDIAAYPDDESFNVLRKDHYLDVRPNTSGSENTSVISIRNTIPINQSAYSLVITITDVFGSNEYIYESYHAHNLSSESMLVSDVLILGKESDSISSWQPLLSYNIPRELDSLRFQFQARTGKSSQNVYAIINSFPSDTTAASPLHYTLSQQKEIIVKGINYDDAETLYYDSLLVSDTSISSYSFQIAVPPRGNYEIQLFTELSSDSTQQISRRFGVRNPNFPFIKTPRELAQPLQYLMNADEYEEMLSIADNDSLKNRIDEFWLSGMEDEQTAKNVLDLYYTRVELANKLFSNFKEGWKTDRGYVFILFGPPWYNYETLNEITWSYNYDRYNPEYNFVFYRPRLKGDYFPYEHYLLERSKNYFRLNYGQIQNWKNGMILQQRVYGMR